MKMWLSDFFVFLSSFTNVIDKVASTVPGSYHQAVPINWTLLHNVAFNRNGDLLEMFPHYGRIVGNVFIQRTENATIQDYLVHCNLDIMLVYTSEASFSSVQ